jgi:di/tricarboxylate transporter
MIRGGILAVMTILEWAFGFFAASISSLLFFLFAVTFGIAAPAVVFSGFTSPAWWLLFGSALVTTAVRETKLAERLAAFTFRRVTASYRSALIAVAAVALGLDFVMPSVTARVLLLLPIVLALADRLGLTAGRPGRAGLAMLATAVSIFPATAILPSVVGNLVLLGAADTLYGIKITYASYLLLHFPVFGALKTVLLIEIVYHMFPEPKPLVPPPEHPVAEPVSHAEHAVAAVLAVSTIFFVTDAIHGISPAWIALAAGIVCLLPRIGPLGPASLSHVDLGMLVYVAGILGLGAVIAQTGLGTALSRGLVSLSGIAPGHEIFNLVMLTAIFAIIDLFTTVIGLAGVVAPLAGDLAKVSDIPVLSVLMLTVPVISAMSFPYQNFLFAIGMKFGDVSLKDGLKFCLIQAALTVLVLFPLSYVWWHLLGYLH